MAFVDEFIGNLRGVQNVARGLVAPKAQPKTQSAKNVPKNVDQPTVDWNGLHDKHIASIEGQLWEQGESYPEENIVPGTETIRALNYDDVRRVLPYKPLFEQALTEYVSEPDGAKRIKILDKYGLETPLGTLPGTASYLQILRNTEDTAARNRDIEHNYAETADSMRKMLDAEINKFNPRT